MSEVKAIEAIDGALGGLDADARARVLGWAQAKYGGPASIVPKVHQSGPMKAGAQSASTSNKGITTAKSKTSKKPKTVLAMDKTLNLSPSGKKSAIAFAADKSPTNVTQKCVVAAYYLRDILEVEKVTAQGVLTFFKHLQWPVPSDLKNTLQQAGSAGWLDTRDSDDIKITSSGENLVEHELPAKAKTK